MRVRDHEGLNAGYVAQLLEDYLDAPASVPAEWRKVFEENGETAVAVLPGLGGLIDATAAPEAATVAAPAVAVATAPPVAVAAAPPVAVSVATAAPDDLPAAPPQPVAPPRPAPVRARARADRPHGATRRRRGAPRRHRGRDGSREGVPHARSSLRATRPARLGADRRPGAGRAAAPAAADPRAPGADPGPSPAPLRGRRHAPRGSPAAARGLLRADRVRDRAHLRPRRARLAPPLDRVGTLPAAAARRGAPRPAGAPDEGRGLRAVPAPLVPRSEAVLARGPRRADPDARRDDRAGCGGRRTPGRDGDGAPRPPQRAGAHRRAWVRVDPAGVRGGAVARRARGRPRRWHGRREVPPARDGYAPDRGRGDRGGARAQPEPSGGRRPGCRGPCAGRADRPLVGAGLHDPTVSLPVLIHGDASFAGTGRRRGDPQPAEPRRLLDRRHAAPDRQQPGRLHDRPDGEPLHALLERPREGLRRADRPRQRGRSRSGVVGRPPRARVPDGVRPRLRDRPDRLPALRPQRAGRGLVHAAVDGGAHRAAADGARAVRVTAGRGRRHHRRRGDGDGRGGHADAA